MSRSPAISRRSLLRALALALPVALLPGGAPDSRPRRRAAGGSRRALRAAMDGLLPERASAQRIGRAYLHAHANEADADGLTRLLVRDTGGSGDDLARRLQRRVRRDFREADVVWVRGWLLSRTEARLCALSLLS